MFVLALSPEGRRVAMGEVRPELAMPGGGKDSTRARRRAAAPAAAPDGAPNADPELVARLKSWRGDEARRKEVPAYVVFPDKTLVALAAARPRDREGLLAVKGIGAAKLEMYGDAMLRLLRGE